MSNKPKEGDKYVIEIQSLYGTLQTNTLRGDRPETRIAKTTLFRIKGFPSVVFTEADLLKLDKYEEQPEEPEIKVGDEVINKYGSHVVVTRIYEAGGIGYLAGLDKDGRLYNGSLMDVQRTGIKFPGIESAIAYMRRIDAGDAGREQHEHEN